MPRWISICVSLIILLMTFTVFTATADARSWLVSGNAAMPLNVSAQMTISPGPTMMSLATSTTLPNTLFASFEQSSIPLYSQNGGLSWYPVFTTPWMKIGMTNPLVAITPGLDSNAPGRLLVATSAHDPEKSGVYRTEDNGQSWTFIPFRPQESCNDPGGFSEFVASPVDPTRLYLIRYCFLDIVQGRLGFFRIFMSSDAGINWQPLTSSNPEVWGGLVPSPSIAGRVYVRDGSGNWYQSDNGGLNWSVKSFPVHLLVLDAQDPARLYGLSGGIGKRSIDGGITWSEWNEQPCPISNNDEQLLAHPTKSNVLFLRCYQGLYRSRNGGDNWERISGWHGQLITANYGNPERILWARDDGLWTSGDEGNTWSQLSDSYQPNLIRPWQNASIPDPVGLLSPVTPLSPNNAWAVGANGIILNWQGSEWISVTSPIKTSLSSIAFASPTNGWAVGDQTILHWDGSTWTLVPNATNVVLTSVDVVSTNDAWAVGNDGAILHWNGNAWNVVSSTTTLPLKSIDMVSATDGWAVGGATIDETFGMFSGIILRWNGSSWTTFTTTTYIPTSVDVISETDGWIVGGTDWANSSQILHWDGTFWQQILHPASSMLSSVAMASADKGWAVGPDSGLDGQPTILHWDGNTWTQASIPTQQRLRSVTTLSSHEVWITGYDNTLLHSRTVFNAYLPWIRK